MAQPRQQEGQHMANMYADVHRLGQSGEYERALRVINKILQENNEDATAFHCKIVCFVQLSKFEEALSAMNRNQKLSGNLVFEKAYCEYRLNRTQEALRTLDSTPELNQRLKELRGQVLYRLEQFENCYDIYRDLLRNTQDDFEEERETNLSAVIAALQIWGGKDMDDDGMREDTYELCYNAACLNLGKLNYNEAATRLRKAEELCRKMFEDDGDVVDDEVDAELGVVRVQLGYTLQRLGKKEEAMQLYNQVLKKRPTDAALAAIASNNVITLNKEQNVFDSKKKMKVATASGLQQKLISGQRRAIAMNQCLLALYTNQGEECRRLAEKLRKAYPGSDTPTLIEVAQRCRDSQVAKAVELLTGRLSASGDGSATSLQLTLALAQLHLVKGNVNDACSLLRSLDETSRFQLAMVSALVGLYVGEGNTSEAIAVLQEAVDWYRTNEPNSKHFVPLMRSAVAFQLKHGDPEGASELLEELRRKDPNDLKTLAQLISAYSKFNPQKAQLISRDLPTSGELGGPAVDVDQLESASGTLGPKYIKKAAKVGEQSPKVASPSSAGGIMLQKKKKKKKKTILPKNYDSTETPDAERWLPRRERSYYRGKRRDKRKEIGKGTQGSAAPEGNFVRSPTAGGEAGSPAQGGKGQGAGSVTPGSQRPQRSGPGKQKKKKKGGGGKW